MTRGWLFVLALVLPWASVARAGESAGAAPSGPPPWPPSAFGPAPAATGPAPVMPATATDVLTAAHASWAGPVPVSECTVVPLGTGMAFMAASGHRYSLDYGVPEPPVIELKPEMGFAYLWPRWGYGPGIGVRPEDLDYGVVFLPRLEFNVSFTPVGGQPQTFTAAAAYLRLDGNLDRVSTQADVSTLEVARSHVELLVADVIGWKWPSDEQLPHRYWQALVGIRYASLDQGFESRSASGGVAAYDLITTQKFSGIGVTAALGGRVPLWDGGTKGAPFVYANVRGSVLTGDNNRTSTFAAAGVEAVTIQRNERDVVPVGGLEVGVAWGEIPLRMTPMLAAAAAERSGDEPLVIGVKVAAIGQVWGGVGPISAARPPQSRFASGNLYLYGAAVTFYIGKQP